MLILKILKPVAALLSLLNYKRDRLRLSKLINQGLKVGKNVYIMEDVEFDLNYPFLIEIGDNCRVSKDVRILAHDATTFRDLGITRIAPVKILEGTFIGERVIILPGVTIGPRALIAAGSVVNRDVAEGKAIAGNPARPYSNYSDLLKKYSEIAQSSKVFSKKDIESELVTPEALFDEVEKNKIAFIRGVPTEDPYYINSDMNLLRKTAMKAFNNLMDSSVCSESQKDNSR